MMLDRKLLLISLFLIAGMWGCSKEEAAIPEVKENIDPDNPYSVAFTVELDNLSGARMKTEETEYTAYILMFDQENRADSVFSKKVKLLKDGDVLKTEPVKFGISKVDLSHFVIYSKDGVYAAAPLQGSKKSSEVEKTLPFTITVPKNELLVIQAPEVLPVGDSEPRDFGFYEWPEEWF